MKKIPVFFIALGLMLGKLVAVQAQTVKTLTLSEAIQLGLENSDQLKVARSKVREAEAATRQMKHHRLPDVEISGQYMRLNEPTVTLNPLLTGQNTGSEQGPALAPAYMMVGQASVSMPLFSGFRIKNGVRSAVYLEKAAELDAESQRSEMILNIIGAYVNLYKTQEAVNLVNENLQQARQRVKDFTILEKNGLLAQNDLLKVQLQESNTSLVLLNAKNKAQVANFNMNLLLGLEENTELRLESLQVTQMPDEVTAGQLSEQALSGRQDLQAVAERKKASETAVQIAKGEYYPSLALTGGYVAADIDNLLTLSNAMNVGLGAKFSLSSLFKNGAKVHQAKERYQQTQLRYEQFSDKIRSEVFKAFSDFQESMERVTVYEKAQQQAAENYRIVKNKHQNNLATTTELLDADVDKFQAALNLKYARVDVVQAYSRLLHAAGQLEVTEVEQLIE